MQTIKNDADNNYQTVNNRLKPIPYLIQNTADMLQVLNAILAEGKASNKVYRITLVLAGLIANSVTQSRSYCYIAKLIKNFDSLNPTTKTEKETNKKRATNFVSSYLSDANKWQQEVGIRLFDYTPGKQINKIEKVISSFSSYALKLAKEGCEIAYQNPEIHQRRSETLRLAGIQVFKKHQQLNTSPSKPQTNKEKENDTTRLSSLLNSLNRDAKRLKNTGGRLATLLSQLDIDIYTKKIAALANNTVTRLALECGNNFAPYCDPETQEEPNQEQENTKSETLNFQDYNKNNTEETPSLVPAFEDNFTVGVPSVIKSVVLEEVLEEFIEDPIDSYVEEALEIIYVPAKAKRSLAAIDFRNSFEPINVVNNDLASKEKEVEERTREEQDPPCGVSFVPSLEVLGSDRLLSDSVSPDDVVFNYDLGFVDATYKVFASVGVTRSALCGVGYDFSGHKGKGSSALFSFPDADYVQACGAARFRLEQGLASKVHFFFRPSSPPGVLLVQLDDLSPNDFELIRSCCFYASETSPNNYQACLAIKGLGHLGRGVIRQHLIDLLKADIGANGSFRLPGTFNLNPRYVERYGKFPLVKLAVVSSGLVVSLEELEFALKTVFPKYAEVPIIGERVPCAVSFANSKGVFLDQVASVRLTANKFNVASFGLKPEFSYFMRKAPLKNSGEEDLSRVDYRFVRTLLIRGFSIGEAYDELVSVREKAFIRRDYGLRTVKSAALRLGLLTS